MGINLLIILNEIQNTHISFGQCLNENQIFSLNLHCLDILQELLFSFPGQNSHGIAFIYFVNNIALMYWLEIILISFSVEHVSFYRHLYFDQTFTKLVTHLSSWTVNSETVSWK